MNIDGINIYTTMITCDDNLAGQIFVVREELKARSTVRKPTVRAVE